MFPNELHPSIDIFNLCGCIAPDAIAACVPNEIHPDMRAPLIAPQMAPTLLLHGTSMPNVNTPNVVPAAIADNEVATLNMWKILRKLYFFKIFHLLLFGVVNYLQNASKFFYDEHKHQW